MCAIRGTWTSPPPPTHTPNPLTEHLTSFPIISGVRIALSLIFVALWRPLFVCCCCLVFFWGGGVLFIRPQHRCGRIMVWRFCRKNTYGCQGTDIAHMTFFVTVLTSKTAKVHYNSDLPMIITLISFKTICKYMYIVFIRFV